MCSGTFFGQLLPSLPVATESGALIFRSSVPRPTRRYTYLSYQWGRSLVRYHKTRSYQCGRSTSLTSVMHHFERRRHPSRNSFRQRNYHSSLLHSFRTQALPIPPRLHALSHLQHVVQHYLFPSVCVLRHRHGAHLQTGSASPTPQRRRIVDALYFTKPTRAKHQSRRQ